MTVRLTPTWWLLGSLTLSLAGAMTASAQSAVSMRTIQAHTDFLSGDGLEGRATGSRGYELAANYVAAQFRQYGLQPLNAKDGFLQSVPLVEATVVLPGSALSYRRDGATTAFEFGKDYLPSANFFSSSLSLNAPLAFVGFGINAPEYQYNDFANVDVQGRVAVLFEGAPARFKPAARAYYGWREVKYAQLIKQGALAVVEIMAPHAAGDDGHPTSWDRAVSGSWTTAMRALRDGDQPSDPFAELKLKFRMNSEAASRWFAASGSNLEQIMQNLQDGTAQGFAMPGVVTLSATTGLRHVDSNNVIGVVRGTEPAWRNEYVLVTAHLDHLGRGPAVAGDNIYNGLQHNAVGVAMLLDMARTIAVHSAPLKRSVLFAVVTAGDKQGQGLQHLLSAAGINAKQIVAAVALDTPLPLSRTVDVDAPGARECSLGALLSSVLAEQGKVLSGSEVEPLLEGALAPLLRADIPTVMIRSGERASSRRVSMPTLKRQWQRLHWDQPSDDGQGMPVDTRAASEMTAVSVALVERLSSAPRPTWNASSFIGRKLKAD